MSAHLDSFRKTRIYQACDTISTIRADLNRLRAIDKGQEGKQSKWMMIGILSLLACLGCLIAGASQNNGLLVGLAAVLFIAMIVSFIVRAVHGRLNVEDRRYELADKLLDLLRVDSAADAQVTVSINFLATDHNSKYVRKGKAGAWKVKYFADRWLSLGGRLLDGTKYAIDMIEKKQNRSKWKRSRSGKMKHKTKTKSCSEAIVSLKFKPEKYRKIQEILHDMPSAIQLPQWVRPKGDLTKEGDVFSLRTQTFATWTAPVDGQAPKAYDAVEWIGMKLLSLYQGFNLARAAQKAEAKRA